MALACVLYTLYSMLIIGLTYIAALIMERAMAGDVPGLLRMGLLDFLGMIVSYLLSVAAAYTRFVALANGVHHMKTEIVRNFFRRPLKSFRGRTMPTI